MKGRSDGSRINFPLMVTVIRILEPEDIKLGCSLCWAVGRHRQYRAHRTLGLTLQGALGSHTAQNINASLKSA